MDTLTSFIFTTASSALSGIIVSMVNNQIKAVKKEELEKEVARIVKEEVKKQLQSRQDQAQYLQNMLEKIRAEIEILAARDPDIELTNETIELKPIKGPMLPFGKSKEDERLQRLHKIIAQRRKELGLPELTEGDYIPDGWKPVEPEKDPHKQPEPAVRVNSQEDINQTAEAWRRTAKEPEKSYWQQRIEEANRRIQIIRAGGEVIDEQDES